MQKASEKLPFGTKEFARSNVNPMIHCSLNCRYCYAKLFALRFKRIESAEEWQKEVPNMKVIDKNFRNRKGWIMFPSSHNINASNFEYCIIVLKKLLKAGNNVLIVIKPDVRVIISLLQILQSYKSQALFRFTITTNNTKRKAFWEPNAPSLDDSLNSLLMTFAKGYETSVNIEPFLDKNPITLIKKVEPYVTETIWLGKMNHLGWLPKLNLDLDPILLQDKIEYIRKISSWTNIQKIVENIKLLPEDVRDKIRFKDSIKRMHQKRGLEVKKIV